LSHLGKLLSASQAPKLMYALYSSSISQFSPSLASTSPSKPLSTSLTLE